MLRSLVKRLADPCVVGLAALGSGALPGFLLCWQSAEGAGAQGDAAVFGVSPCSLPCAPVFRHLIHVSGLYLDILISAIRIHLDRLDFVLYYSSVGFDL